MPKIQRKPQKIFAGSASGDQIAAFGTMKTGTPVYSNDIETLQPADYSQGWTEAILNDKAPYLEEMNGVQYGLSTQIAYLLQQGLACEWDSSTEYYKGSIVAVINDSDVTFYRAIQDNSNVDPVNDGGTNWVIDSISKVETYKTYLENAITTLSSQCVKLTGNQSISGTKTFSSAPYVPNSSTVGTALRLADRGGGYIKLGDGTIFQWGNENTGSSTTKTVSLHIAFSGTYRVFLGDAGSDTAIEKQKVYDYASKSFKVRSSSNNDSFNWLAIGR